MIPARTLAEDPRMMVWTYDDFQTAMRTIFTHPKLGDLADYFGAALIEGEVENELWDIWESLEVDHRYEPDGVLPIRITPSDDDVWTIAWTLRGWYNNPNNFPPGGNPHRLEPEKLIKLIYSLWGQTPPQAHLDEVQQWRDHATGAAFW